MIGRNEITVRCEVQSADFLHLIEPEGHDMVVHTFITGKEGTVYLSEKSARRLFNWLGARLHNWPAS